MSTSPPASSARVPTSDLFSLRGKTAIVTGATGGIGLTVATALAESGASIVSIQIPSDPNSDALRKAIEVTGQSTKHFECNLLDSTSIADCFERMWAAGIVPDILFNAAGVSHRSMVADTTVETLNKVSGSLSSQPPGLTASRSSISTSRRHTSYARPLARGC